MDDPKGDNASIKKFLNKQNDDATDKAAPEEHKVAQDELVKQSGVTEGPAVYPSHAWFLKWRDSLLLPNIKVSMQHTYSKAMSYRNQMIDSDESYAAGNQIVNIDED